jgi:hypothetical protein
MATPTTITFNTFNLQAGNIITREITHDQAPDRQVFDAPRTRAPGSKLTAAYFTKKIIKVKGTLIGTTVSGMDGLADQVRQNVAPFQCNLDIGFAGSTRRYLATAIQPITIDRPSPVATYADFEIDFEAADYASDTGTTTLLSGTTVSGTSTISASTTFSGTAQEQAPQVTITLVSGGGLTSNKNMTLTNPANGLAVTITRNWAFNDVVVIDCAAKTVTVNGTLTDYTGSFPTWVPGAATIQYSDNFASRKISMSALHTKLWL